jgi:amidase
MMKDNGHGFNWKGLYVTSLIDAHSQWRHRADELSDTLKLTMLVGEWFIQTGRGRFYAKAQNLARKLRAAYDTALSQYDVLLMPTLPVKATPLPPPGAPRETDRAAGVRDAAQHLPHRRRPATPRCSCLAA